MDGPDNASSASEFACAKINLALHVLGRRNDGMHELDTLVAFAEIGDILRVEPGAETGVTIILDGPFAEDLAILSDVDDNLAVKAARALANVKWRSVPGIRLVLEKHLPISAGLGGGSADAAAALRLLNHYWRLGLDDGKLLGIARKIGADVPMCLGSRPVRATGIGDQLASAGLPEIPMVLINPGVGVPTDAVFRAYQAQPQSPLPPMPARFRSVFELVIWMRTARNDLYESARGLAPIIGRVVRVLKSDPDCLQAGMSGSGPTCFGIFASNDSARRAAQRLRVGRPDWWIVATSTGAG